MTPDDTSILGIPEMEQGLGNQQTELIQKLVPSLRETQRRPIRSSAAKVFNQ